MLLFFVFAIFICISPCDPAFAAPLVTIEEIKIGIEKHFVQYDLHEFTYEVKRKNPQGKFEERVNTYRLHLPQRRHPIQCLIEELVDGREYPIDKFVAFDGKQSTQYTRSEFLKGNRSTARIVAFNVPESFLDDMFVRLLATSIVGMPFTLINVHDQDVFWKEKQDIFKLGITKPLGEYNVFVLEGSINGSDVELRVLGPPDFMIVGIKVVDLKTNTVQQDIMVEEVGKFENLVFPKKGRVYQSISYTVSEEDEFQGIDYSFEVSDVRQLAQFSQQEWCPDIPPGTNVTNDITGETVTIPFSDKQKEMIIDNARESVSDSYSPVWMLYLRGFLVFTGLMLIIYALCRMWGKK